jgi:leucyl aminopeptidase
VKTPGWIAEQAAGLATASGLAVTVWDEDRLRAEGFGGILAVGAGSATAARFVQIEYPGTGTGTGTGGTAVKPVVLVGKGVTYDTGGLSIKPREAMVPMKTDMSGAGVVLSVLAACRAAGVRRRVVGLLPLAENAFGASSYRPGDVVRHYGGLTSEVLNTDAEGRMLLADALAFAHDRLDPAILVDVATLTGAATLGLGRRHAALYATDDGLAAALERASAASGERVWRMPLVEDYRPSLDSDLADLKHIATDARLGGGSIVAALFLREFTGGRRWAHLDIAGPGRADRDENEVTKGATGFGARLLLRWLESLR